MPIKLTLTLKPRRRSLRIMEKRQQARHTPYPARKTSGARPTPTPQPRVSSPATKEESRASSPVVKRESRASSPIITPPATIIPTKTQYNPLDNHHHAWNLKPEDHPQWEPPLDLYSIPQYYPPLGPNTGSSGDGDEGVDPRYVPGNYVIDEEGVERRVLGRGEVRTLTTLECWENGDLF
ncbi:hypothetical protein JMJ35_010127 [Cladonia borealis]|uniref:Uncharacterized protein n=1 Tax=Cladonia borealis TaxID=184061 RepID=A0AA39QTG5_9LECA|nr:hypothetical protein JMJ35_010127 [Cladonia borealis]